MRLTMNMFSVLSQGRGAPAAAATAISSPTATLSVHKCSLNSTINVAQPNPPLISSRRPKFLTQSDPSPYPQSINRKFNRRLNADANGSGGGGGGASPAATTPNPNTAGLDKDESISIVGQESVTLEGVIQLEKPDCSSPRNKWGRVALLAGGDVLALLLFSAIGRFSHGFSVFDTETLHIADLFISSWVLSGYFLGGYGEDGLGMNGLPNAVIAATKSWALGIPLGFVTRATTVGHTPPTNFILVAMGSTAVLLIGWRALFSNTFCSNKREKNNFYKHGSPFKLFEITSKLSGDWQ